MISPNCPICNRPRTRTQLGVLQPVHDECHAGKPRWCEWFKALPEGRKTQAGWLLYYHAIKRKAEGKERAAKSPFLKQGLTSTSWERPCLVGRLTVKGSWVINVLDRPFGDILPGTFVRMCAVKQAPPRGFSSEQEARRWAASNQVDLA